MEKEENKTTEKCINSNLDKIKNSLIISYNTKNVAIQKTQTGFSEKILAAISKKQ